jgi:hypothetical protein
MVMPDEKKGSKFGGNRGVDAKVYLSFMCSEELRDRVRKASKDRDIAVSELIRDGIELKLREIYG